MRPPRRTRRDRCSRSGSRERFDRRDGERGAPNGGARRHAARAAPRARAGPPRRRGRAQPRDRAAPQAGRRDRGRRRRDRAGAFRGRGLPRMTMADDAVRYARLAREAGFNEFVKLEVIGDQETLLPDVQGLLDAARTLVKDGFKVLAYTNEDLVTALRLEDAGCAAVMPLASPIGSGLGLLNPYGIRIIKRRLSVPVVVDAGVGTASDACVTMEQGVDGILMNTALAAAR